MIVLNPTTGAVRTVLRVPTNDLIDDAQPSPDGRYLAYLDSRCDRPGNKYIRVQDLTTGRSWTIGAGLRPCDPLGSLSWTSDGRHLVTAYGRSLVSRAQLGDYWGLDRCLAPAPAGFRVVPALKGQPRVDGPSAAVQKDCSLVAVTVAVKGYAAIESCPYPHDMWSGSVRLLSYSPQLRRSVVATLGSCYDGSQLRANAAGTALLGWTGLGCGQPDSVARIVEFTVRRHRLMVFHRLPNGYGPNLSAVSW